MPLWVRPILVLLIALLLLVPLEGFVDEARDAQGLKPVQLEEAPALDEVALTTGLGAGRSFINISTWNAIEKAQQEREYYRVISLSRTALRLQPNNPEVLDFLSRQLVFTISRTEAEQEAAWGWVEQGMEMLESARRRNPHSALLRRSLGSFYYQMMSEHPIQLLKLDLSLEEAGRLARDPAWQARAEALLEQYAALGKQERARLDHVIERIGFSLVHVGDPRQFPEYDLLEGRTRAIYDEINLFRFRLALLEWVHALDPAERVEGDDRFVMAQWAITRIRDLLAYSTRLPRSERPAEQAQVWRWAVQLYEWMPDEPSERAERSRHLVWNRLAGTYDRFGPPGKEVRRDGLDLVQYYFGRERDEPPPPPSPPSPPS